MVEPVVAAAVAWAVLDQRLTVLQMAGGALVLGAVTLAQRLGAGAPAYAASSERPRRWSRQLIRRRRFDMS
jgi:drug/metabolite transporter (DMT)-like permease